MLPLHSGQLSVLRVRALMMTVLLGLILLALDLGPLWDTPIPFGLVSGAGTALLVLWGFWSSKRRYESWGYKVEEDELHVQYGIWTRVRTVVPFSRVQHIDVAQGPLERRFGVGRLILHTAGTRSSAVGLPGLEFGAAAELRDLIRSRIRQEPT